MRGAQFMHEVQFMRGAQFTPQRGNSFIKRRLKNEAPLIFSLRTALLRDGLGKDIIKMTKALS